MDQEPYQSSWGDNWGRVHSLCICDRDQSALVECPSPRSSPRKQHGERKGGDSRVSFPRLPTREEFEPRLCDRKRCCAPLATAVQNDRVGCRGLRAGTLPHHRTCGFLASGGWNLQRSSVPNLQPMRRRTLRRIEGPLPWARRLAVWNSDRSCHVPLFRSFSRRSARFPVGSVGSFGPSHRDAFLFVRPSIATTASADFPAPLSAGISPGQVPVLSVRTSGLYRMPSVTVGLSCVVACSPPTSCLSAHLCSFSRTFAFHPFAPPPCGDDLAVRLRLASLPPSGTFHPDRPGPCRAHDCASPLALCRTGV
jgi:hypothetical protein